MLSRAEYLVRLVYDTVKIYSIEIDFYEAVKIEDAILSLYVFGVGLRFFNLLS
jgi:hypothetical protein